MRTKTIEFAGKSINVQEKRIGELETLTKQLFPSTKGKLKDLDKALNDIEIDWDLLYKKIPVLFPELTVDDVKNAYMSEIEELIKAFVDVNFFALKQLMPKMMALAAASQRR